MIRSNEGFLFRSLDAICQNFQLELDDIVILSTDGLFDNVPDNLIERIISKVYFSFFYIYLIKIYLYLLESFFTTCS
jgi:hypothetical protein